MTDKIRKERTNFMPDKKLEYAKSMTEKGLLASKWWRYLAQVQRQVMASCQYQGLLRILSLKSKFELAFNTSKVI